MPPAIPTLPGAGSPPGAVGDIRLAGFSSRIPLADALAWIDACTAALPMERIVPADAAGRVLAAPVASPVDWPGTDCAALDGYAVCAVETEGAGEYNPLQLAEAGGVLEAHGVAIRPGDSAGLGRVGGVPLLLLPGAPHACLAAYALLASRAVRRLAGVQPLEPGAGTERVLERKAVSAVGFTDMILVRTSRTHAVPLAPADAGTLAGAAQADGYVVVPEASEGFSAGATVQVHPL